MAKKKTTKKSAKKKKSSRSTKADIKDEKNISRDIEELEKEAQKDEEITKKEIEEVKKLDEDVAKELSKPKKEMSGVDVPKRNYSKIIIIAFAIIIILLGILYWQNIIFPRENLNEYNGFDLRFNANYWEVNLQAGWMPFMHHPTEVDHIPVDPLAVQSITNLMTNRGNLQITVDPQDPAGSKLAFAGVEISKVTAQLFAINTTSAFLYELEGYDAPIVRCRDAKGTNVVIRFVNGTTNEIIFDDYCIFLRGTTPDEYTRLADALSFRMLGIIN